MAKPKHKGLSNDNPQLEMTPMIDVVFQLLIFFIVTLKQEDILSRLMASRPAPDPNSDPKNEPQLINVVIHKGGFIISGRPYSAEMLDRYIRQNSQLSKSANVLIRCTADSPQTYLMKALDTCNKYGMRNISIFSM